MTQSVHLPLQNIQIPFQQQFLRAHVPVSTQGAMACCHICSPNRFSNEAGCQVILNLPLHAISLTHHWNLKYISNVCGGEGERKGRRVSKC